MMDFLTQLERTATLWKVLVPTVTAPPEACIARWLNDFGYDACEIAIRRVPWRFRDAFKCAQVIEPDHAHKFVTQTLLGLRFAPKKGQKENV
jgi:hypothetical protein